jgi:hypothetical protein
MQRQEEKWLKAKQEDGGWSNFFMHKTEIKYK